MPVDRELEEHRGYLSDEHRVAAYRTALREVVRPDDVVLDLGAGTGLLGMLACEAGAKSVVAVDFGDIIELARRVAADNGYADRVTHVQLPSTDVSLDTPADVVVCDQIGGLVRDAGILRAFADAKRRLTAPDARFVPAGFDIFVAPVTFTTGRDTIEFWSSSPAGVDVHAAREQAVNSEWRFNLSSADVERLSDGRHLASFASHHDEPILGNHVFTADRAGRFDGWLGWFEAEMSPTVRMTNDPWAADRIRRWCSFLPLDQPVEVAPGDTLTIGLDIRPRIDIVSWRTTVVRDADTLRSEQQSSFKGEFLSRSTVDSHDTTTPIPRSPRFDVAESVLKLLDGEASQDDIVDELLRRSDSGFANREELAAFVRRLVKLGSV